MIEIKTINQIFYYAGKVELHVNLWDLIVQFDQVLNAPHAEYHLFYLTEVLSIKGVIGMKYMKCKTCLHFFAMKEEPNFCPKCGSPMIKVVREDDKETADER